ncbi:MAG: RdgB/HAM1 family non-canonical purine NTP pyrophosphatase [Candidatus Promineifilaceae bacterium]
MSERLLVASHNQGKVAEYADLLDGLEIEWLSLDDVHITVEMPETGDTFLANAAQKAAGYALESGLLTLADDSGLEVDALYGAPGVHTARYGGPGLDSRQRYELLLANMDGVHETERGARFRCAIVLAAPDGTILASSEGAVEGRIAETARGEGGFGYDPVFYLPEFNCTMAELPPGKKHRISHRGRALRAIKSDLAAILGRL